jgi:hypothetical protein
MRVYFGLIMFAAFINLVQVLQVSVLAFHWLDDCALQFAHVQIVCQRRRKMTNTATPTLSARQAANHLLYVSVHNYGPLVINRNDKRLTLLGQCKLAFTRRNMLTALKIWRNIKKKLDAMLILV